MYGKPIRHNEVKVVVHGRYKHVGLKEMIRLQHQDKREPTKRPWQFDSSGRRGVEVKREIDKIFQRG